MQAMIDDALDLARLRVRPLEAYQYPLWQTALLITLLGVIAAAAGDGWIQGDWSTRVGFFVAVSWLETGLLAVFMTGWLRHAGWQAPHSLLGLVALANAPQLLEPLASWLPADIGSGVVFALSVWSLLILLHALVLLSGMTRLRVACGMLVFAPLAIIAVSLLVNLGLSAGLLPLPPEMAAELARNASN